VCPLTPTNSNARKKFYGRARAWRASQRRMEREAAALGLAVHTRCACGCGLVIKPSIKRPFARGHRPLSVGVMRVVPSGVVHE
jgi:hypothetical protein